MFRNYIVSSLRSLRRQWLPSLITLGGLAIGIASFSLILAYIFYEQSFDKHWSDSERVVRITTQINQEEGSTHLAITPFALAPALSKHIPWVDQMVRVTTTENLLTIRNGEQKLGTRNLFIADSSYFNIFQCIFIEGNPDEALNKPQQIVLCRSMAKKLFGDKPALGRELIIGPDMPLLDQTFTVSGVIKDIPKTSHLCPQVLASMMAFPDYMLEMMNQDWSFIAFYSYLKVDDPSRLAALPNAMNQWKIQHLDPWIRENQLNYTLNFDFQPLEAIHHEMGLEYDSSTNTDIQYVHIFGALALLILVTVSINYINLSTARAVNRASEVGLRKTVGADNRQVIGQFLGESVLISFISFILGVMLAELFLPAFREMLETPLGITGSLFRAGSPRFLLFILGCSIIMGLISGFFPGWMLSRFKPVQIVGRDFWNRIGSRISKRSLALRRALVVFQFALTAILIIATFTILRQLQYIQKKDLGFEKEQMVVIKIPDAYSSRGGVLALKEKLMAHPAVTNVTYCLNFPGFQTNQTTMTILDEDPPRKELINYYMVDESFLQTLQLDIREGTFFEGHPADSNKTYYAINQAAQRIFNGNPIGTHVICEYATEGEIIGITRNFHYEPLHQPVKPLIYINPPNMIPQYLGVKTRANKQEEAIQHISNVWTEFGSKHLYTLNLLEEQIDGWYQHEKRMLTVMFSFALLTLLLASLGLFGLACYLAIRKRREIAIRKALGSSSRRILAGFVQHYLKWILIANLIAWPFAAILMNQWLKTFAFHIEMTWLIFLSSLLITVTLALITIGYHAYKTANTDPAAVLKDE
jgi:putative ABC transport system permease protein